MIDFAKPKNAVLFTFILLILTAIYIEFEYGMENFGINKTVGHAWEFSNIKAVLSLLVLFLSFFSYCVMWFFDLKLNKSLTLFNLAFLVFCLAVMSSGFQTVLSIYALLILIVNITYAIRIKMYDKKQNLQ